MTNVTFNQQQQAFIDSRVLATKRELLNAFILTSIESRSGHRMPMTIDTFGELHDFCDANCLGGMCDDDIADMGNALFPERTDPDTLFTQGWMDAANVVQETVHGWLVRRESVRDVELIAKHLRTDEAEVFLGEDIEAAHAMLDVLIGKGHDSIDADAGTALRALLPLRESVL